MHVIEINLVYCCSRSDRIETKGIAKFPRIGSSESQSNFSRKFDWLRIHGRCRGGGGTNGKNMFGQNRPFHPGLALPSFDIQ